MSGSNQIRDIGISNNGSSDYNAGVLIQTGSYGFSGGLRDVMLLIVGSGDGEFYGIYNNGIGITINNVFISMQNDTYIGSSSPRKNIGIDNHSPLTNPLSLTIQNSTILTQYSGSNIAVRSDNANITILNSTLGADSGGFLNRGLSITNTSDNHSQAIIQNSNLSATSGKPAQNAAIYNDSATGNKTTIVQNSTLTATGDTTWGGTLDAIYNPGNLQVGASEISGNVNNTGTLACAASYNGSFVAVGNLCV
jgi:hypothetical protein